MALQFVLGPSGAGKSEYIYNKMIQQSIEHPDQQFILLVPEQYSLAIQRKIVTKHPRKGSFQIDVIGFNRLAYRVFDEQHIQPAKVLEDFGKSMLLRQAAYESKGKLSLYGNSLDKAGFIDEAKSLMSELYQYAVPREHLEQALCELVEDGEDGILAKKLHDMVTIFDAFEEKKGKAFIVAEQILELLTNAVEKSKLIADSEIILDGFTGFTPIQMNLLEAMLRRSKKVTILLTIDYASFCKKHVAEHELFALTKETIDRLLKTAEQARVTVEPHIFLGQEGSVRWEKDHPLYHLEQNLFRYPYRTWIDKKNDKQQAVNITVFDNPYQEMTGVAAGIRDLVMRGYRYRDIAIVSGDLEKTGILADRIFPRYDIPYFVDMTKPVKNHPCVDALSHSLRVVEENFSYDSVFAFLKSGVLSDLEQSDIEKLENYVLARGRKGIRSWMQPFQNGEDTMMEEFRVLVMEILHPFYKALSGGKKKITSYVDAVYALMDQLSFEDKFEDMPGLYEKLCQLLDKMVEIMPDDKVDIREFEELFQVGMKDINLGMVPPTLDMVIVGDIMRTRLSEIRVLFIVGVNDGVIPKRAGRGQILNDREKERLQAFGIHMAPTERVNSYTEQFYLYQNMTKPTDALFLSYVNMSAGNESMRPSYIIDRIRRIFPSLRVKNGREMTCMPIVEETGLETLALGMRQLLDGNREHEQRTLELYKLFMKKNKQDKLAIMEEAMRYQNIPKDLEESAAQMIRLQDMAMSVSKLEQYAQCAYAFFLKYVLHLREREIHGIDSRNIGVILHGAMEQAFSYVKDNMDNDWKRVDDNKRDEMAEQFVKQRFKKEYENQDIDDGQYIMLEKTLVRIGKRTLQKLQGMVDEQYKPSYFEYAFKKDFPIGDTGEKVSLSGIVDRGDIRIEPEEQKIYLRVIDYKSGAHNFDIGKLYEGLELQLAIYTEIMTELVQTKQNEGKTKEEQYAVIPDGMFYFHMQDPYVKADTAEDAEQEREKTFAYKGLDREDTTVFDAVVGYAGYKAGELAGKIERGIISKNPNKDGEQSACDFCAYKDVCRFDEKYGGNRYHYTKHSAGEKEKILEVMSKQWNGQQDKTK